MRVKLARFGENLDNVQAEIAQLVEHATENRGVASSILALGTLGLLDGQHAGIVQLVEHLLAKEKVTGSSPVARSTPGEIPVQPNWGWGSRDSRL
jgi:hypothetical protein